MAHVGILERTQIGPDFYLPAPIPSTSGKAANPPAIATPGAA